MPQHDSRSLWMEIYATLVSEILKYYYDVEDINGNDCDEFEYARNIFAALFSNSPS